jgi:hypothetical protein
MCMRRRWGGEKSGLGRYGHGGGSHLVEGQCESSESTRVEDALQLLIGVPPYGAQ